MPFISDEGVIPLPDPFAGSSKGLNAKVISSATTAFSESLNEDHIPDKVLKLVASFKTPMVQCPDKIWPDFSVIKIFLLSIAITQTLNGFLML